MKCEELLKALNEYVDGTIDPEICKGFEEHLAGCNPCKVVVDTIRQTIQLYKLGEPYEMPEEFQRRLGTVLKQHWEKRFGRQSITADTQQQ